MINKYVKFKYLYFIKKVSIITLFLLHFSLLANAGMKIVADKELASLSKSYNNNISNVDQNKNLKKQKNVITQTKASYPYPSRLSDFNNILIGNVTKSSSDLKINMDIFGSIGKIKMGYYNLPTGAKPGAYFDMWPVKMWVFNDSSFISHWDIEFENIRIGEDLNNPFMLKGLRLHTYYDESNNIQRMTIGSDDASGRIYIETPKSFTGLLNTQLAIGGNSILDMMTPIWARRTYLLNGEGHGTIDDTILALGDLKHPGQEGFKFNGINDGHGLHIVFDKDHGIGFWAGFPINDIDTGSAFDFPD